MKYNRVLLKLSGESLAGSMDKGIDFENDVLSIIEHLKLYYTNHKFEFEVYNPKELNREDEGYELAFVKIIEH